jgi:hypothetical protein
MKININFKFEHVGTWFLRAGLIIHTDQSTLNAVLLINIKNIFSCLSTAGSKFAITFGNKGRHGNRVGVISNVFHDA